MNCRMSSVSGEHNRMLKFEAGHGGQVPGQPQCPRNISGGQGGEAGSGGGQFCHVLNQVYGGGGGPGASGGYHGYYGGEGAMGGGGQGAGEQRPCVTDYLAAVNRHSHKQHYIQVSVRHDVCHPASTVSCYLISIAASSGQSQIWWQPETRGVSE